MFKNYLKNYIDIKLCARITIIKKIFFENTKFCFMNI
jgi:hypothetical protein